MKDGGSERGQKLNAVRDGRGVAKGKSECFILQVKEKWKEKSVALA